MIRTVVSAFMVSSRAHVVAVAVLLAVAPSVASCGSDGGLADSGSVDGLESGDTAARSIELECLVGETEMSPPAELDTSGPGAPTAEAALRPILESAIAGRGGGEIVQLSDVVYAVSADSRVVWIATAAEPRPGEWHFVGSSYCE